jgi:hypothetical protein
MSALDVLEAFCRDASLPYVREEGNRLGFQLRGERKLTIAILAVLGDTDLRFESFFMRKPMEQQDAFYELLLQRNHRARGLAFALDAIGDVYVVARLPLAAVTSDELDALVGAFLIESDGMFDAAMRTGFATYLEADLAWRAKQPPA